MRIIVAGSTEFTNYDVLAAVLDRLTAGLAGVVIVSGRARGADMLGEVWATENKIKVDLFPADWAQHGNSAGPRRNAQMAQSCGAGDWLVAFWDGATRGTADMIHRAHDRGLRVRVYDFNGTPINLAEDRPVQIALF